jgi:hypothetical protein
VRRYSNLEFQCRRLDNLDFELCAYLSFGVAAVHGADGTPGMAGRVDQNATKALSRNGSC